MPACGRSDGRLGLEDSATLLPGILSPYAADEVVERTGRRSLVLETNSERRADALRRWVEQAVDTGLRHHARESSDPLSERAGPTRSLRPSAPELSPEEGRQLVLSFRQKHYADWADVPLPALGGETPRDAARSAEGRAEVDGVES